MKTHLEYQEAKSKKRPISLVTCYDSWTAKILLASKVDSILVGDSAAMTMHGFGTTLPISTSMMAMHVAAVSRVVQNQKLIIGDLPFLSYRKGISAGMRAVEKLMKAGAHAVKLEGVRGNESLVRHIVESGVPVMGHLGLTPQSVNLFGGMKVQARDDLAQQQLLADAKKLQEIGCFSLVLECVPAGIAQKVTSALEIPTIGIGAGKGVDGQVLVFQDLIGADPEFKPKFVRKFINAFTEIEGALNQFHDSVQKKTFPSDQEIYHS